MYNHTHEDGESATRDGDIKMFTQQQKNDAYYAGRRHAFNGVARQKLSITFSALQSDYDQGFKHASSEIRLDNDVEWD
jgi:hypothetical protein